MLRFVFLALDDAEARLLAGVSLLESKCSPLDVRDRGQSSIVGVRVTVSHVGAKRRSNPHVCPIFPWCQNAFHLVGPLAELLTH